MKLFDVPRGTHIRLLEDARVPVGGKAVNAGDIVYFSNIDGMYSYCTDKDKDIVHIAAFTEVEVVDKP